MGGYHSRLVDILREIVEAHTLMRRLFARHRTGELRFEELDELVADGDRSVLFRLKERCHALFRPRPEGANVPSHREMLVDLAVGSLYHEAMKFRENLYQHESYGPRVRALRSRAAGESAALFEEFERIQEAVTHRLEEGLQESEALLDQTAEQLLLLLADAPDEGLIARYLIQHEAEVKEVFGLPLDRLFERIHGSAAKGYEAAGRSCLWSGFYERAVEALTASVERGGDRAALGPLTEYARGMAGYLAGDFGAAVAHLEAWAPARGDHPAELTRLARDAIARIGQLARGDDREQVTQAAGTLLQAIAPATDSG
jgi:hypothetical protein